MRTMSSLRVATEPHLTLSLVEWVGPYNGAILTIHSACNNQGPKHRSLFAPI